MRSVPFVLMLLLTLAATTSPAADTSRTALIERLRAIPDEATLIVPATVPAVARIVVFTDTSCPYCLRLHRQRRAFSQRGIEIQYLFYPRSGPASASFDQAIAVWCADDRLKALDIALRGEHLPDAHCSNPVMQHYELARTLELKGTPAIVTTDGAVHYGLRSPDDLVVDRRR